MRRWVGPRGRVLALSGSASLLAKSCAAANLFVSLPFVLHALGPVQFGVWATLVSFVTLTGFLDFGLGNGAMNLTASAHARQSHAEVAAIIRAGTTSLLSVSGILAALLVLAGMLATELDWWDRLSLGDGTVPAAIVVVFSIVASVPLNLAARVRLGLGEGSVAFTWQAIGQITAMFAVIVLAKLAPSLVLLTAATVLPPVFAALANTLQLWRKRTLRIDLPLPSLDVGNLAGRIRREGYAFFLLQLAVALAFMADLPIVAAALGAERAGEFAIVQRVFSVIPLALSLLWAPLWPIYRQALAKGDLAWTVRTLRWSILMSTVFALMSGSALALLFHPLSSLWLSEPPAAGALLLGGFVAWCVLEALGNAVATLLNAASVLRYQVATSVVFAALCFATKVWAVSNLGVEWMPWATMATYLIASILPLVFLWRRIAETVRCGRY